MLLFYFLLFFLIFSFGFIVVINGTISYGSCFFINLNIFEKIIVIFFSFLLIFIFSFKEYSTYELISDNDIYNYIEDNNIDIKKITYKDVYLIKDIIICQNKMAYDKDKIRILYKEDNDHLYD